MRQWTRRAAALWLNASLANKLIWIFLLLLFVPVFGSNVFAYFNFKDNIGKNAEDYTHSIIDKMLRELDDSTREIERFSSLLLYFENFEADLSLPGNSFDKERKMSFYVNFLQNVMNRSSVYILDGEGHAFYNNTNRPDAHLKYEQWTSFAQRNEGRGAVVGTELVKDFFGQERYLLTTVRELRSKFDLHRVGTMVIDSDLTSFETIIGELDNLTKGRTIVLSDTGEAILQSGGGSFTEYVKRLGASHAGFRGKGEFKFTYGGEAYMGNFDTSKQSGWTIIVATPYQELLKHATSTRNTTALITMASMLLALAAAIVTVTLLTRPLKSMETIMKDVQVGNFDIRFPVRNKDEIGRLGLHFNRMIQRIGELIEEVYKLGLRKNKAELELLQSQINPHFLYNTLEMIRMAAEMNRDAQVSHMVFVLGKLLRYGVNTKDTSATVRQELEHIQNYMFLYNFRSGKQATIDVHVDPDLYEMPLMKLLFQPILENALIHGSTDDRHLRIAVRSIREEGRILFEISDNGTGMSPERLEEVRTAIHGQPSDGGDSAATARDNVGIGLKNSNERIQLYYGSDYGLQLDSVPSEGTTVTIRLPA
ncbi:sensor histidine kinase [Cohnella sp. GCM10027633]|uniref:cache domain-containing sensor histidine kinase n=1 Tax=unclassified Cohnella TaxID=2636738 RepID=UPI003627E4D6